jgi:hypothetical protein
MIMNCLIATVLLLIERNVVELRWEYLYKGNVNKDALVASLNLFMNVRDNA